MAVCKFHLTLVCCMFLAGCGHVAVTDAQRTGNPAFNGAWIGDIDGTEFSQHAAGWEMECGELKATLYATVADGRMSGYLKENENISFETNLNDAGRFYAAVPKKRGYRETAASDRAMRGKEFFVFRGQLDATEKTGKGRLVRASEDMAMEGCSTSMRLRQRE